MRWTALAGGVGAAKLLSGMAEILAPGDLTIIVNTGDDFCWMGLYICPDIDTITYTLSGLAHPATGWGVRDDTYLCLERLKALGVDTWFRLGDRDLATHLFRTDILRSGQTLTQATQTICRRNGLTATVLPMTDSPVPTLVRTAEGTLDFQDYFARRKCAPVVSDFVYQGIDTSVPAPGVIEAIGAADVVLCCPSNPFVSIGPILGVPGIRAALRDTPATVVAVSPIVGGEAIKGPTAVMLSQLGHEVSATGVARLYRDFIDTFVLDRRDEGLRRQIEALGLRVETADTIMCDMAARVALARSLEKLL